MIGYDDKWKPIEAFLPPAGHLRYGAVREGHARELAEDVDWDAITDKVDGSLNPVARQEARERIVASILTELTPTQQVCLSQYVLYGGYDIHDPDSTAWRAVAKEIGTNPATGENICSKTVKRNVLSALEHFRQRFEQLPDWQAVLLGLPDRGSLLSYRLSAAKAREMKAGTQSLMPLLGLAPAA